MYAVNKSRNNYTKYELSVVKLNTIKVSENGGPSIASVSDIALPNVQR